MKTDQIKNNLNNMHILRGIAAFYVVIYHSKFILWSGGSAFIEYKPVEGWGLLDKILFATDMFTSAGKEMVFIFFLLSGFFISYSLQHSNYSYLQFLKIRVLRIYLPFLGSLFIGLFCLMFAFKINPSVFIENSEYQLNSELFESFSNFNFKSFIKTLFLTREGKSYFGFNNVYWSLAYEMIFYFIIGLLISKKKRLWFGYITIMLYLFVRISGINLSFERILFDYFIFFGLGVMLQILVAKYESVILKININKYVLDTISFFSFAGIILSLKLNLPEMISEFGTLIFSLSMIYRLIVFKIKKNLITSFLIFLGNISYSLYLCHIPFLILAYSIISLKLQEIIWYDRVFYWVFGFASLIISLPLYYLVEKPSIKLNQRLKQTFKANKNV